MPPAIPIEPAIDLRITSLTRRFGDVTALESASLDVQRGELVSILGPSGCGKSTLLQLVAGHLTPDSGSIEIAGRVVTDERGEVVPPQQRGVGMVFQDYALFPHLTAQQNVVYGMRSAADVGVGDGESGVKPGLLTRLRARRGNEQRALELLDTFGIADLAGRFPGELSGGQQQRVAIARAVAQQPHLLLLDEPFCNLDAATREHVRSEIVARLRETGLSCVFVTHDQEEALAISDRVAVMHGGRVMQIDEPETLYRRPFCLEVAEFLGRTNVLRGSSLGGRVETEVGSFSVTDAPDGDVEVLVRPELIDVRRADDGAATVIGREFRGHDVLYTLRMPSGNVVWAHRPSVHMASVGDRVRLTAQPGTVSYVGHETPPLVSHLLPDLQAGASSSSAPIRSATRAESAAATTAPH